MSGGTIENCYTQYDGSQGGAVYNFQGATFNMSGGTIAACSSASGGGVYNAGTFNMSGSAAVNGCSGTGIVSTGTTTINGSCWVSGCSGGYGGGIRSEGGTTTITSGNIYNSTATYGSQLACTGSGKIIINGGNIDANNQQNMMGAVFIQTGSTAYGVELRSGNIKNSYASNDSVHSGGVTIYSGAFWMSGGWINYCRTTADGGAVWVANGLVQMTGGRIYGCTASGSGGAIHSSQYNNTVNISGTAQIDSNTASSGGGLSGNGTINISGGKICSNTATSNGGGVHFGGGTLTISGGEIYSNWGKGCGGGLRSNNGTINMTGGKIYSNKSPDNGNGIQMHGTATFTMTGGEIYGNCNDGQSASNGGGGILAWDDSKVYIYGGTIRDNSCNGKPGAAILFRGTEMDVYGGRFTGNTTTSDVKVFQREDAAVGAVNVYGGVYDVSPTAASYGVTVPAGFVEAQVSDALHTAGRNATAADGTLTGGTYTFNPTDAEYVAAGMALAEDRQLRKTGDREWTIVQPTKAGDSTWAYVSNSGTCWIEGTGDTADTTPLDAQWADIRDVRIADGVTGVGNHFFDRFYNLTNVTVAASCTTLGKGAFYRCFGLEQITFEGAMPTTIGENALNITAGIRMEGETPVVYAVPNVTVNGKSMTLMGKVKLTDAEWQTVTAGHEGDYHFFKFEAN